jgi:thioredoxin reductase (NADPH)
MSDYLVQRIRSCAQISICIRTEIMALEGDDQLRCVTFCDRKTGDKETREISNVFVMIGASPKTTWLCRDLKVDAKGFIITGTAAGSGAYFGTNQPGVFAVGDVRSGSVKRVASAVGDGSAVVSEVHKYLMDQTTADVGIDKYPREDQGVKATYENLAVKANSTSRGRVTGD